MNFRKSYVLFGILSVFILVGAGPCEGKGIRNSFDNLGPVQAYNPDATVSYDTLLQKYVVITWLPNSQNKYLKMSRINYRSWLQNAEDLKTLKSTLQEMSTADTSMMNEKEQKAFFINAYNAMTLDLVLSRYDETYGSDRKSQSIKNIGHLGNGVWDLRLWTIAGKKDVSLNDVEHKILRPMGDARIHVSIVCASKGCPPLYNHALSANTLDDTLDLLAENFVNSDQPNTTRFDYPGKSIKTSEIVRNWYASDFEHTYGSVKGFFQKYVKLVPASQLEDYRIKRLDEDYDWSLNQYGSDDESGGEPGSGTSNPNAER